MKNTNNTKSLLADNLKLWCKKHRIPLKITFFIVGFTSTIWFLIRVIPKPSRATYPCMQAAAPMAASFVVYLLGLMTGMIFLRKGIKALLQNKLALASLLILATAGGLSLTLLFSRSTVSAITTAYKSPGDFTPNAPVGEAKGINPGRVVWVWNPEVTNENLSNTENDYWYFDKNTDQAITDAMLDKAVMHLTGKPDVKIAWDDIFKYFNKQHNKGNIGYQPGEKIFIKLNLTNSSRGMDGTKKIGDNEDMDATPQFVLSMLQQLIEVVGVDQSDIYCGDPYRTFRDFYWDKCHSDYPDVHYVDGLGINGREKITPSADDQLFFSDGVYASRLPEEYLNADYFINMSCLKSHDAAGITMCAKNHQGSYLSEGANPEEQSAYEMHYCFPTSQDYEGYGKYRHIVDYMGHEKLGGNTLLYIVDAIWAGRNWLGFIDKWNMSPFEGDYPSSIFISQDPVAIESVGYDFLLEEYKNKTEKYPWYNGVDDYLLQAADSDFWPENIQYDPENDGSVISSLGVYEHWNNSLDMLYTRNLHTGDGIELIKVFNMAKDTSKNYADPTDYDAYKADELPVIDGIANEKCWQQAQWAIIEHDWFKEAGLNPPSYDSADFYGRYKASWSDDYLYLLVEITDDVLNDDVEDPLDRYWEEDCVEIFIDEDNSGGGHRATFNAFAYHTSPVTGDVVDYGTDDKPHLFNEHMDFEVARNQNTYTYEYQIKIFDKTYTDQNPDASRVVLQKNTSMGFSIAYCEDDGNGRENFIGSTSGGYDSWLNASLFGQLNLLDTVGDPPVNTLLHSIQEPSKKLICYPNPARNQLTISLESKEEWTTIEIYTLEGKKVLETSQSRDNTVNISQLDASSYILVVSGEGIRESCVFRKIH